MNRANRVVSVTFAFLLIGVLAARTAAAVTCYNGWVTPTSMTYNFTSMAIDSAAGGQSTLISTPFSVTFNRTDANFASTTVSNVSVPFGRYTGVNLAYASTVGITLNGVKFDGDGNYNCSSPPSPISPGATLYTASAANVAGAINTTGPAVALNFANPSQAVTGYFPSPICVTDSSQSACQAGDLVFTSSGAAANSKGNGKGMGAAGVSLTINLLVDLYDSVSLDGGSGLVLNIPNIAVVPGVPGAAVHLTVPQTASGGTVPFNASLLFGPDKSLLVAQITQGNGGVGGSPLTHSCQGGNNIAITGASSNTPYEQLGAVSTSADSGKGQVLFPVANTCSSVSVCNSNGTEQIDNIFQAVGNNATLQCVADSSSSYQTTNFSASYTGGAGAGAGSDQATIVRIVDPNNLFGACASSPCVDTTIASGAGGYL